MDLIHFGEQCAPGIIIDEILKIKKKDLFMYAIYDFNSMLQYLKDGDYEKIYSRNLLKISLENPELVHHTQYNFSFNHDYKHDNSEILNYDFCVQRFQLKIQNFKDMLVSESMGIFITFTNRPQHLKIDEMIDWLSIKKNFLLFIFTNTPYETSNPRVRIIFLENCFDKWWRIKDASVKLKLYDEIYTKFICNLDDLKLTHNYPKTFQETGYKIK